MVYPRLCPPARHPTLREARLITTFLYKQEGYAKHTPFLHFLPPLLQPLLNTRLFSLITRLIIPVSLQTLRQILLQLPSRWSFRVLNLHILIILMRVLVIFAVI